MDPNSHETPGLGLPPLPAVQGAPMPNAQAANDQPHSNPAASMPSVPPSDTSGGSSDDLDEEWVNKAKAIVERTKNDPFLESRELNKIKADYLKARHNRDIKVSEDNA